MLGRDNMRRYSIANLCSDSSPDSESGYASYGSAYRNTVAGYNSDTNVRACSNQYPYGGSDIDPYRSADGRSDSNPDRCPNSSSHSSSVRIISYGAGGARACKQ